VPNTNGFPVSFLRLRKDPGSKKFGVVFLISKGAISDFISENSSLRVKFAAKIIGHMIFHEVTLQIRSEQRNDFVDP